MQRARGKSPRGASVERPAVSSISGAAPCIDRWPPCRQALLDRDDRYIANPGGEREKRRVKRAIDDRIATLVADLDQIEERQFEILFENAIVDEVGRRIDDEPPAA